MDIRELIEGLRGQRRAELIFAALLLCALAYGVLMWSVATGRAREATSREASARGFEKLKAEYIAEKALFEPIERRLSAPPKSATAIVEELGALTGIRKNITSIKPMEGGAEAGFSLSGAEVKADSLTLNQVANLVYRMEAHANLIVVKEFSIKSRFENPELFDVTLVFNVVERAAVK